MKIYSVRHGETLLNAQNKVCGTTDTELSDHGRGQARQLAEKLLPYPVEQIFCSPMKRARETAGILAQRLRLPVTEDCRLAEINFGEFEGAQRDDPAFLAAKRMFAARYPGGESMFQAAHRIYGFLEELIGKYPKQNILLVSHGGVCRIIHSYFREMSNEEFFRYSLENCGLEEYCL